MEREEKRIKKTESIETVMEKDAESGRRRKEICLAGAEKWREAERKRSREMKRRI